MSPLPGNTEIPYGMWVLVAVRHVCDLIYSTYFTNSLTLLFLLTVPANYARFSHASLTLSNINSQKCTQIYDIQLVTQTTTNSNLTTCDAELHTSSQLGTISNTYVWLPRVWKECKQCALICNSVVALLYMKQNTSTQ